MLIDEVSANPDHGLQVTNEKISVHRSLKTSHPINVIKTTIDTLAGDRNKMNFTAAVKAGEAEIIFVQRFGMMPAADGYDRAINEKDLEVARWDPTFATYVVGVLVATKDVVFQLPPNRLNILISSFETEHFRFWILSSFLMVPAHESMFVSMPVSLEQFGIMEVIPNSAPHILDFALESIQHEYLALAEKLAPEEELLAAIIAVGGYVSTGSDTPEFWKNMDRVMEQIPRELLDRTL
ncbi:hypothetical protein HFO06_21830 [Rhizobium leguminosarum]|uniref:hypothetical protein n=1 Tax=Rhizobium leguminosarum TaxID=384 RepID=UPI001C945BE0|nr:hypothetical protein [Rhizobium leguminosarum]MBY5765714.1 hypothetical protein [Rhizobium leguminosarum]